MILGCFLTTERSEVVPFFRAVRARKKGREATLKMLGARLHSLVSCKNFAQMWMELDETWQEGRFGQAPQIDIL